MKIFSRFHVDGTRRYVVRNVIATFQNGFL